MFLLCAILLAQASRSDVLKGLEAVRIVIDASEVEMAADATFSRSNLVTDTEIKLRRIGLRVEADGFTVLYLKALALSGCEGNQYSVALSASLLEPVAIARTETVSLARTWHWQNVGYAGKSKVDTVRQWVGDGVDEFINDWLKANPPARSAGPWGGSGERPRVIVPPGPLGSQPVTKKY